MLTPEDKEYIKETFATGHGIQHSALTDLVIETRGMKKEMEGINRRLDISNGNIAKNKDSIVTLQTTDAQILTSMSNHYKEIGELRALHKDGDNYWRNFWVTTGKTIFFMFLGGVGFLIMTLLKVTGIFSV